MTNNNLSSLNTSAQTKDQLSMIHLFKNNSHLTSLYKSLVLLWLDWLRLGKK